MSENAKHSTPTRLIPVSSWSKYHEWPPVGGLRHLIFNEERNGFSVVVRRIGRRVLIDECAFFDWARNKNIAESTTPINPRRKRAA